MFKPRESAREAPAASYSASAPVVEYIAPAASYVAPTPVDEYVAPVPAVDAAPAPVVEFIAPAHAVSCSAPVLVGFPLSPDASDMSSPEDVYARSWESLPVPTKSVTQVESAEPLNLASETPTVFRWSRSTGYGPRSVGGSCPVASKGSAWVCVAVAATCSAAFFVTSSMRASWWKCWRGLAVRAFWSRRLGGVASGTGNEREEDECEWHGFW